MYTFGLSGSFFAATDPDFESLPEWLGHDAAACLVGPDGAVVAAVEQERLDRVKHSSAFPAWAVRSCAEQAGISVDDVGRFAFCFEEVDVDGFLRRQQVARPALGRAASRERFVRLLGEELGVTGAERKVRFVNHHLSHAASAYLHSGFEECAVAVVDGSGGRESTSIWVGRDGRLERRASLAVADSLGNFYTRGTELLGYREFDEYKVMGLAPHGDPARFRAVLADTYRLLPDGRVEIGGDAPQGALLATGFRPRRRGEEVRQDDKDVAAALQESFEAMLEHVVAHWLRETGSTSLAMAGGAAHNCSANGALAARLPLDAMFVHPASHDAGAALGAALVAAGETGPVVPRRPPDMPFWGPTLRTGGAGSGVWGRLLHGERVDDPVAAASEALAGGAVIGWMQGRSEFGPRSLGNRSILADAGPHENQTRINAMVKRREGFRPFAPAVPQHRVSEFFEVPAFGPDLAYMSFVLPVRAAWRERLAAITHVDGTARIQTVERCTNRAFFDLLEAFGDRSGYPVLLNTSYNNNAEPIVDSTLDALTAFVTTDLDLLVLGSEVFRKRPDHRRGLVGATVSFVPGVQLVDRLDAGPSRVALAVPGRRQRDISRSLLRVAGASDGRRVVVTEEHLDELFELWCDRFVALDPD